MNSKSSKTNQMVSLRAEEFSTNLRKFFFKNLLYHFKAK